MMNFTAMLFNIVEKCTLRCRHCGYEDSTRDGLMTREQLLDWLTQTLEYGISHVIFTGGEPFGQYCLLESGLKVAADKGGTCGIFTNCSWGSSYEKAVDRLRNLARLTLTELYLSSDKYHLEFVPLKNILNVARAAKDLGIPAITICITYTKEKDRIEVQEMFSPIKDLVKFHYSRVIRSDYIEKRIPDISDELVRFVPENFSQQCFLHTPLVNPTGTVAICHIGKEESHHSINLSPYYLGNLHKERLADIFQRAENNTLYQFLRTKGPRSIVEAALASDEGQTLKTQQFVSECEMCFRVLSREKVLSEIERRASDSSIQGEILIRRLLMFDDIQEFQRI